MRLLNLYNIEYNMPIANMYSKIDSHYIHSSYIHTAIKLYLVPIVYLVSSLSKGYYIIIFSFDG